MGLRSLMWILWPSFLAAAACSALIFALIDPLDVAIFGHVPTGRTGFYRVLLRAVGDGRAVQRAHGLSDAQAQGRRRAVMAAGRAAQDPLPV